MTAPVSVLIPSYCCADTVTRAVKSVAGQTLVPAEIIMVDDASPDEGITYSALKDLQQKFSRSISIRIIRMERNGGPGAARNRAWDAASQPYIAFLDADDAWHPRKLEIQCKFMESHADVVLSGHATFLALKPAPFSSLPPQWKTTSVTAARLLATNVLPTRSVMLKREISFRFEEGRHFAEDYHLWLRVVLSGHRACRIELPLTCSFKPDFGASGLSGQLWQMERGEIDTYTKLRREGLLNAWIYPGLISLSLLKFSIRSAKVLIRRCMSPSAAHEAQL